MYCCTASGLIRWDPIQRVGLVLTATMRFRPPDRLRELSVERRFTGFQKRWSLRLPMLNCESNHVHFSPWSEFCHLLIFASGRHDSCWWLIGGEGTFEVSQNDWCFAGKESDVDTKPTSVCVHIRWMIRRDMPAVLGIENRCFEFAWNEDDFIRCLRQRNCIGMVAEEEDKVVGFMIYELHKNRLHILNFAVDPDRRRHGIGQAMVSKLLGKLSHERRNRIMLEVRETNLEAQLFFKSIGFRAISVLRDFYDDTVEDAYLMQYRYQPSDEELAQPHNRISRLAG